MSGRKEAYDGWRREKENITFVPKFKLLNHGLKRIEEGDVSIPYRERGKFDI